MSIHKDAEADLDALYQLDPEGTAMIDVFLEEASASQEILDRFTDDKYRSYDKKLDFEIQRWRGLWKAMSALAVGFARSRVACTRSTGVGVVAPANRAPTTVSRGAWINP